MANVFTNVTVYTGEEKIENAFIRFSEEILAVGRMSEYKKETADQEQDASGKIVLPGFIDVHSHGGYSYDNMDANSEEINQMIQKMHQEGITSYFATTMTQSYDAIDKALVAINEAAIKNPAIQGIHLEGPFVSKVFKGAQPEEFIRVPDAKQMEKWNKLSGNRIRLVTYASETSDASEFEDYCVNHNIVLSIGHSNATRAQLMDSKASHITHLYNAQRGLHHREPGVTGHAFLEDSIYTEMIVDGYHIHPDMVNLAYKVKGPDRIEVITDSMRAKGLPDGESELGGQKVLVKNSQARLEDGTLAGSVLTFNDAFKNIMAFTGCSIEDAVKMTSVNQAREFGLNKKGSLKTGMDADLILMSNDFDVEHTFSYGKIVY